MLVALPAKAERHKNEVLYATTRLSECIDAVESELDGILTDIVEAGAKQVVNPTPVRQGRGRKKKVAVAST
jgi:hypothetical protein